MGAQVGGTRSQPGKENPENGEILRAKYLDYCSAKVAETLLLLSPDEMYVLAQDAARDSLEEDEARPTYPEMVRLATARVYEKLDLPLFKDWAEEYRKDPARFDEEILGLWQSEGRGPSDG